MRNFYYLIKYSTSSCFCFYLLSCFLTKLIQICSLMPVLIYLNNAYFNFLRVAKKTWNPKKSWNFQLRLKKPVT